MKHFINYFKFLFYFYKNVNFDYTFYVSYDESDRKIVRLRVYDVYLKDIYEALLHDIKLHSKAACRAEFLARLDGETPMQIWNTWRQPEPEELLVVGTKIWYFYGGWRFENNQYYDEYVITETDVQLQILHETYMNPIWARVPNKIQ